MPSGGSRFVYPPPRDDLEFVRPGNRGEEGKLDLLTALGYKIGHLLGQDYEQGSVMAGTLTAGTRQTVSRGTGTGV